MKLIDADKLRAEIERLYGEYKDKFKQHGDQYHLGLIDGLDMAERVLDTLSEEPDKSLEEAAKEYAEGPECTWVGTTALEEAFKAGAKCQKEQDTRDMFMSDNRHFNKVYELGKKDMKEQMLKDYSWLVAINPSIEPKADIIHTTDTAPVDGNELLHVADKSYKIGWRDCKQQMLRIANDRYEQAMTFVTGNSEVDQAIQMDRLALVKIIEEREK